MIVDLNKIKIDLLSWSLFQCSRNSVYNNWTYFSLFHDNYLISRIKISVLLPLSIKYLQIVYCERVTIYFMIYINAFIFTWNFELKLKRQYRRLEEDNTKEGCLKKSELKFTKLFCKPCKKEISNIKKGKCL